MGARAIAGDLRYFFLAPPLSATLSGLPALSDLAAAGLTAGFVSDLVSVLATAVFAAAVTGFFFAAAASAGRAAPDDAARSGRFFSGVIPIVRSWGASPVGE